MAKTPIQTADISHGRAKRNVNTSSETRGDTVIVQVSPGVHMIELFWKNDASANSTAEERTLTVKEI